MSTSLLLWHKEGSLDLPMVGWWGFLPLDNLSCIPTSLPLVLSYVIYLANLTLVLTLL
jgi:hypothetical protein